MTTDNKSVDRFDLGVGQEVLAPQVQTALAQWAEKEWGPGTQTKAMRIALPYNKYAIDCLGLRVLYGTNTQAMLVMPANPLNVQQHGFVSGPSIFGLGDVTGCICVFPQFGFGVVSKSVTINYLRPAPGAQALVAMSHQSLFRGRQCDSFVAIQSVGDDGVLTLVSTLTVLVANARAPVEKRGSLAELELTLLRRECSTPPDAVVLET